MNEDQVKAVVQKEINKNNSSGAPFVPPHLHDGINNLQIPSSNIGGFVPLPSSNKPYANPFNGTLYYGFASPKILQSPAFEMQGNQNALYPLPIVFSNAATGFQGGYAPEGTITLFIDPTVIGQAQLWSLINGQWYGVDLSTTPAAQRVFSQGSQVFTASGTFTVPAGVTKVKVRLVGAGAGGGATAGADTVGAPGGSGGYSEGLVDLTGVGTVTVTIGTAGTGGVAGGAAATNGGATTFGAYMTGNGGNAGGTGGTASGGSDLNLTGYYSPTASLRLSGTGSTTNVGRVSAEGAPSYFGPGGGQASADIGGNAAGNAGQAYGSGGSGAASGSAGGNNNGGNGKDGVCIIEWVTLA